tara:strand:- start:3786 stop:3890 length:105 start_codon:yes stop_codon:yes gene_type:complete
MRLSRRRLVGKSHHRETKNALFFIEDEEKEKNVH